MNDRLAAALTRNTARRMIPEFLEEASAALHRVVRESDLISATESAALLQVFNQKMAQLRQGGVIWTSMLVESDVALEERSRSLSETMPEIEVFLYRARSKWCGAIRSTTREVLSHVLDLVSLDQEDVIACSTGGSVGIFCSLDSRDDDDLPPAYHFAAWSE